ncbi:type IV secretion system protein VirB8 [Acidocella sp.]|uniref:type IV secretion system protein VirB8 n=1 Tax=Acidocella sp. TaxID=50710 RepID=UPI0017C0AFBB|nr:type IV secretion system protein VirB8 [Acidocella sp.]NNM55948.1 type IV secretion system protein VirB8 [Acidocella sp.]
MSNRTDALPLTAPMLERHYKEVASFQEARARLAHRLSKGLVIGLCISMLGNLGQAWSIVSLLPLEKLVPVYFVIRPDGTIDSSPTLSTLPATTDQAVIRAALWEYVTEREGYSYDTARYRWDIVSGMSDVATRASYQQWFQGNNPQSPQVTIGKNGLVTVQAISVAMIGPNVAQVRFERVYTTGQSNPITTTWTATLQFEQINAIPVAQRLNNPAGVVVTSYQVEEDTAP